MGKKNRETTVEQYRRRLGQHEKHSIVGRHKEKAYQAKELSQAKKSKPLLTIVLFLIMIVCFALLIYFFITYMITSSSGDYFLKNPIY